MSYILSQCLGDFVFRLRTNNVRLSVSSHLRLMERPHENQQSPSSASSLDVSSEEIYSKPLDLDDEHSEYFTRSNGSILEDPMTCPSPPKKKCKIIEPQFFCSDVQMLLFGCWIG